jgi:hypothetical protein
LNPYFCRGELAEWSIAAVLKTVDCYRSGGSNPSLSAIFNDKGRLALFLSNPIIMKSNRTIRMAFIAIFLFVTGATNSFALPTNLEVGQLSIIGFNSGLPNKDGFAFVCWVPLNAGTVINFTDNGFNSASSSTSNGNYRNNEQTSTWTATTPVAAGTVVTIEGNGSTVDFVASTGTVSTINSTGTGTIALGLANNGDQIFAFQGPVLTVNNLAANFPGKLLYGVGWPGVSATTGWTASSNAASFLPSDIAGYGLFFGSATQGAQYTGARTGFATLEEYKALVNNPAKWSISTTGIPTYNTNPFVISGTLPLDLLSFTGKAGATGNKLSWATANEVNIAGCDIERSADGEHFDVIGSVVPNAYHTYNYLDNTATESKYFYRLKMRDIDGRSAYSSVIIVDNTSRQAGYTIYPNPVAGSYLHLKSAAGSDAYIQITVLDMSGRALYKSSAHNNNNGRFEIPVKQLPAGLYVLQISDKNGQVVQAIKFSK